MVIESASPAQRLLSRTASSTVTGRNGREAVEGECQFVAGIRLAGLGNRDIGEVAPFDEASLPTFCG
jgi:hypothetical protein